jgi:hypothetical protein
LAVFRNGNSEKRDYFTPGCLPTSRIASIING